MTRKAEFTVKDLKAAFPEYPIFHSDDPAPARASIMLPKAMLATIDLERGFMETSVSAYWGSDERIEFTSSDETDAQCAIEKSLLPAWKAAGFEPTGERGFQDDTPGVEPAYSVSLKKAVHTLDDVRKAFRWIADEAKTSARV